MESVMEPAILFWIPLCLIPIGIWLSISKKAENFGKLIAGVAIVIFLASPWTVSSSDSTAGAHLILSIIAPTILLVYGLHGMIFGGNVPVGRLDSTARYSGYFAVAVSIGIFCLMHWFDFTPIWRNDVNPYWIVFWPTFLLFATSLCAVASIGLIGYGDQRISESIKLAVLSVLFAGIAHFAMVFDGKYTTAEQFRDYIWLAVADIFGILVGGLLAVGVFAAVIWSYEKSLPTPKDAEPPTESELKKVVTIAKSHIEEEE